MYPPLKWRWVLYIYMCYIIIITYPPLQWWRKLLLYFTASLFQETLWPFRYCTLSCIPGAVGAKRAFPNGLNALDQIIRLINRYIYIYIYIKYTIYIIHMIYIYKLVTNRTIGDGKWVEADLYEEHFSKTYICNYS